MQIFSNTNYNFIRWRWHALGLSAAVIIAGVAVMATRGLPLGIDFSGGTALVVKFEQTVTEDQVRSAVAPMPGDKVIQQYGDPADREHLIRLPMAEGAEEGASLEEGSRQVEELLRDANLPAFEVVSRELVGPVIGADLQRKGIYATLASLFGITVYIAFRFRFTFAVGALAAVFHDVLVTLALLALFKYELSLNVVAAILAITGYSVNDTIVVFDRVRENLRSMRRDPLGTVINRSVNQTLARTIITSGTTLLAVVSLFVFGGEVLRGFAFTMIVGVISGTYSTVFIASTLAIILTERKRPGAVAAVTDTTAPQGRKQRRARAS
jgi:preprotein translocase subunit SecF